MIFGAIYQGVSPLAAFAFSSACALLAAVLLAAWSGVWRQPVAAGGDATEAAPNE